jgi:hypothetical protein
MNRKDMDDSGRDKQPGEGPVPKKAYRAPSFRVERVFETTALTCGKVASTQEQCITSGPRGKS